MTSSTNRATFVVPIVAALFGGLLGYFAHGQLAIRRAAQRSAVLTAFDFKEFIAQTGSAEWNVLEDKIHEPFPPLSRDPRTARRIVAQATMEESQQADFADKFQQAADKWITSRGGVVQGEHELASAFAQPAADGEHLKLLDMPRRFYAVGDIKGVADFWCFAEDGSVTVIISLVEGS